MNSPRRWALALTAGALAWSATLFIVPVALAYGSSSVGAVAALVYESAGVVCHQRPERSFRIAGVQQPVCARCAGLYVSGALGALIAVWPFLGQTPVRRARLILAIAALPTAITVGVEVLGLSHPSNMVRALAALPLGAAAGWVFVRMLLDD